MFHTLEEFTSAWGYEAGVTQQCLDRLTDASLGQSITPEGRTIGRLAWHLAQTLPEMMARTGLQVTGLGEHDPVPPHAAQIAAAYSAASASLLEQIATHWTDATLEQTDDMYGDRWTRAATLGALIAHQAHHRGQLTVLMRQAGLTVPGIYGPVREEWATMGMEAPPV